VSADDDLDRLYSVRPEEFTALRKDLSTAAKKRGDPDAARLISAARRPTVAGWVVNTLVRADATARPRLAELTEALRAAHSAMDGQRIRELSTAQRKLVDELARTAFAAVGISEPTAALRDDVTGTLQAAIADREVAGRLGRLEKAEQWSGFGEFDASTVAAAEPGQKPREPEPAFDSGPTAAEVRVARKRRAAAVAEAEAAQTARGEAVEAVADRKAKLKSARRRYEKLLESLHAAERELSAADAEHVAAEQAAQGASDRVEAAESALAKADSELSAITARQSE
jgi:hypothetical protein